MNYKPIRAGVICLLLFAVALIVAAETPLNVNTGLWQVDMTLTYSGLPPNLQAMVDRMTPEQRARMGYGGTKTYRHCVTGKQLNTPFVQGDENCRWAVVTSTTTDLDVRGTSCRAGKNEGLDTQVEVKIHAVDSAHVHATMRGTATGNGVDATLEGNYNGKWVATSCPANLN